MRNRGRNGPGFTLIEVLVALVVFMVAMLGVVALQRASISGASIGRQQTAAVNIARFVMASLQSEAAAWPLAETGTVPAATDGLPLLTQGLSAPSTWVALPDVPATTRLDAYLEPSTSAKSYQTVAEADSNAPYCVGFRVEPLSSAEEPVVYQIWVRVTWPRWGQYGTGWKDCTARLSDTAITQGTLQVVEMTGVVTREFTSRWTEET